MEVEEKNNIQEKIVNKPYEMKIVWFNAIGFLLLHLGAIYGVYLGIFCALSTGVYSVIMGYFCALSTTMGSHRLFTHRTYKANKWLRFILVAIQTTAGQNCLWIWVRDHRQHHKFSDTDADPHNATRGFFFSHIGWLMVKKHPEVIKKGATIDMSDINADPMIMFQKKHYKTLFVIMTIIVPTSIPCIFWNESLTNAFFISFVARLIVSLNITWLVNSAAHIYGNRPFSKDIKPVENIFVSFFAMGEGWHNYHHTFPWDYRTSEYGVLLNLTTYIIDACAYFGLVYDLKSAPLDMVERQAIAKGDGSHKIYGKIKRNEEQHNS